MLSTVYRAVQTRNSNNNRGLAGSTGEFKGALDARQGAAVAITGWISMHDEHLDAWMVDGLASTHASQRWIINCLAAVIRTWYSTSPPLVPSQRCCNLSARE